MKKIFLWGKYDLFSVGNIKYSKEPEDFMVIGIRISEDYKHRTNLMIDNIKYVKNTDDIPAYRSIFSYFKSEKPDYLAIMAEHESIACMSKFNEMQKFCADQNAELVIVRPFECQGIITVNPCHLYDQLTLLKATKL